MSTCDRNKSHNGGSGGFNKQFLLPLCHLCSLNKLTIFHRKRDYQKPIVLFDTERYVEFEKK